MQLGMIGLGRMGANMVRRLTRAGHECVVYDAHPEPVQALVKEKAVGASTLEEFVAELTKPRAAWSRGTSSTTAETPTTSTTSAGPRNSPRRACITSTSAPAAASGAWSGATA